MKSTMNIITIMLLSQLLCYGQILFEENFEGDLSAWHINDSGSVKIFESKDFNYKNVLELTPNGKVLALIKKSDQFGPMKIEGEMLFPKDENNYLGLIYNYNKQENREDFGLLYIKGNGSYIRANPWRDGNVSRLLYEEYKTNLVKDQVIKIGNWHKFKLEVVNEVSHLYINNMDTPKITFELFELKSGYVGFQPRVTGGKVWIDNIKVTSIKELGYKGKAIPDIEYKPDSLLTEWEVFGPLNKPINVIEKTIHDYDSVIEIGGQSYTWKSFKTDKRGAIITGRITEYEGENTVAYFRTIIESEQEQMVTLHFTTTDELTLFLNGYDYGRVYRDGYVSKENDWNAWYDFWKNPKHSGRRVKLPFVKGKNQILIRVRNGQFASGGFFVHLEK